MKVMRIDSLMKYLRDYHNIDIKGSKDKQYLKNIGYYHTFKGYRYIYSADNRIAFKNFKEIVSLYEFDSNLKELLYPKLMNIETYTKNRVLQILVEEFKTDKFNEIYDRGTNRDPNIIQKRLKVRSDIYSTLSTKFNKNKIVKHFYSRDNYVPIWGIFEIITLGQFAELISSLDTITKKNISNELQLISALDTKFEFPEDIIYILKDLRNSVAHNGVIFDARFKNMKPSSALKEYLKCELQTDDIYFNTIVDYFILMVILLKKLGTQKKELLKFISDFNDILEKLRKQIDISVFNKIALTNKSKKINDLLNYIKK